MDFPQLALIHGPQPLLSRLTSLFISALVVLFVLVNAYDISFFLLVRFRVTQLAEPIQKCSAILDLCICNCFEEQVNQDVICSLLLTIWCVRDILRCALLNWN